MAPEMGRAAFRLGMMIALPAFWLLFFERPGTAGFAVTVFTLLITGVFLLGVALVVRYMSH